VHYLSMCHVGFFCKNASQCIITPKRNDNSRRAHVSNIHHHNDNKGK
jgi:hypothetical protein